MEKTQSADRDRKNRRRGGIAVILLAAAAVTILLAYILSGYPRTVRDASDINSNSHLGLEYFRLSDDSGIRSGPDNPYSETTADGLVTGYYFEYPYYSGKYRLTQLTIDGPGYDLYGISVGAGLKEGQDVLESKGFRLSGDNPYSDASVVYTRRHVSVVLRASDGSAVIEGILVSTRDPVSRLLHRFLHY